MKTVIALGLSLLSAFAHAQRTPVATDNFDDAATLNGSDWAQLNATEGNITLDTASDAVYGSAVRAPGSTAMARWVGAGSFTNSQYSSLQLSTAAGDFTESYNIGVAVNASADTGTNRDAYVLSVESNSPTTFVVAVGTIANGSYTQAHQATVTLSIGDRIELESEDTDADNDIDEVRVMVDGGELGGSFTFAPATALSGGAPGITGAGEIDIMEGANWEGGNVGAGGPCVPCIIQQLGFQRLDRGFGPHPSARLGGVLQ